jgi:hypothetical protein
LDAGEEANVFRVVYALHRASESPDEVRRRVESLPNITPTEQILVCQLLRSLSFAHHLSDELFWGIVTRNGWLMRTLEALDLTALDLLFDAIVEHQVQTAGRWNELVPNQLASAVLRPTGDLERRRLLFAYCLISSLASATVDALARILHSEARTTLERDISYWTIRCELMFPELPAWGQARIRPVLALLSRMRGNPRAAGTESIDESVIDAVSKAGDMEAP